MTHIVRPPGVNMRLNKSMSEQKEAIASKFAQLVGVLPKRHNGLNIGKARKSQLWVDQ